MLNNNHVIIPKDNVGQKQNDLYKQSLFLIKINNITKYNITKYNYHFHHYSFYDYLYKTQISSKDIIYI